MLSFTPVWGVLTAFCAPAQLGTRKKPLEQLGGMYPTEAHGAPGIKAGNPQRLIASSLLVRAKHSTPPPVSAVRQAYHLQQTVDRKSRHRSAYGHGLQHHKLTGFASTGKDKHVGADVTAGQRIAWQLEKSSHLPITLFDPRITRAHTAHYLGAWNVKF